MPNAEPAAKAPLPSANAGGKKSKKNDFTINRHHSFSLFMNFVLPLGPAGAIIRSRNVRRSAIRSLRVNVSRLSRENWRNAWFRSGIFWMLPRPIDIDSIGVEDNTKRDNIFTCAQMKIMKCVVWCNSCAMHEINEKKITRVALTFIFRLCVDRNEYNFTRNHNSQFNEISYFFFSFFPLRNNRVVRVCRAIKMKIGLRFSRISYVTVMIQVTSAILTFVGCIWSCPHVLTVADAKTQRSKHFSWPRVNNSWFCSLRVYTGIRHTHTRAPVLDMLCMYDDEIFDDNSVRCWCSLP